MYMLYYTYVMLYHTALHDIMLRIGGPVPGGRPGAARVRARRDGPPALRQRGSHRETPPPEIRIFLRMITLDCSE